MELKPELNELLGHLGSEGVITDRGVLHGYEVPERGSRGHAKFLLQPASPSELSAIAGWAHRNRERLTIQGANTGLVEASTPDDSGEQGLLSLRRLNRLIDFDPDARVAVLEAGMTLSELNFELGAAGQMFPIELASDPTVGGLIATNAGGARTILYGDAASRLLGLEAVLANESGSSIGSPSGLIKDNSRLKLDRVFAGSFGALGVISRLAVRTALRPRSTSTAFVGPKSHRHVMEILLRFEKEFPHDVSAFEFISSETIQLTSATTPGFRTPLGSQEMDHVLIEVTSNSVDSQDLEEDLAAQIQRTADRHPDSVIDAVIAPPDEAWAVRRLLSDGVMRAGSTLRFDISVPRRRLPDLRDHVLDSMAQSSAVVSEFGHWGDGGTHLALVYTDRNLPEDAESIRRAIYDKVVLALGGSFSSEHGLGRHNSKFYELYVPEFERSLALQMKRLFDPRSVWGTAPFA